MPFALIPPAFRELVAGREAEPYVGGDDWLLTLPGLVDGHLAGGFALIAYPAKYGSSGVMTFLVNQDGIVFEKNLGPNTTKIAPMISAYNPDQSWKVSGQ